jgi:M6 family metalloprotease-like protein
VAWQDQSENANEENLFALKGEVGRVIENGTVTDYSEYLPSNTRFSLSEYFDMASYGKLNISTFVTDWFIAPFDYSEYRNAGIEDEAFREAAHAWLMETYPDMDWTPYDKDGNGYFDAVMFVNVGKLDVNEYYPWAFSGGAHHLTTYNGGNAGTPEKPTFNGYINVNADLLAHNTLIHEFGHNLGLIDYYDVTYTGIDAVGGFDMQSGNIGDWNPYSKYAAGWTSPMVPMGMGLVDIFRYARVLSDINFNGPMELQAEYPNGGAQSGADKLTLPREMVIGNLKRDVLTIRAAFQQSGTGLIF